jgi:formate dehydrogenase subunit delta
VEIERLVKMANDIGAFFRADADRHQAAQSVATHLKKFWDPRMRRQIVAHHASGGAGLEFPAREGVALLAGEMQPK